MPVYCQCISMGKPGSSKQGENGCSNKLHIESQAMLHTTSQAFWSEGLKEDFLHAKLFLKEWLEN